VVARSYHRRLPCRRSRACCRGRRFLRAGFCARRRRGSGQYLVFRSRARFRGWRSTCGIARPGAVFFLPGLPVGAIVRHIPPSALQGKAGMGNKAFGRTVALRAGRGLMVVNFLAPFFKNGMALFTLVFVNRHSSTCLWFVRYSSLLKALTPEGTRGQAKARVGAIADKRLFPPGQGRSEQGKVKWATGQARTALQTESVPQGSTPYNQTPVAIQQAGVVNRERKGVLAGRTCNNAKKLCFRGLRFFDA
jgi:hypothetical protein